MRSSTISAQTAQTKLIYGEPNTAASGAEARDVETNSFYWLAALVQSAWRHVSLVQPLVHVSMEAVGAWPWMSSLDGFHERHPWRPLLWMSSTQFYPWMLFGSKSGCTFPKLIVREGAEHGISGKVLFGLLLLQNIQKMFAEQHVCNRFKIIIDFLFHFWSISIFTHADNQTPQAACLGSHCNGRRCARCEQQASKTNLLRHLWPQLQTLHY